MGKGEGGGLLPTCRALEAIEPLTLILSPRLRGEAKQTRGTSENQYVRITVLLATVLLITAIGQRFRFKAVRVVFMILAGLLLCLPFWQLLLLPRI